MKRFSGILMPVFSLPSKYGIGDFGSEAYNFVDFLKKSKQTVWQVLPLVQTGYGNSPYSSVSSRSFSPYYISPEILYKKGLVTRKELSFTLRNNKRIDYGFLYSVRYPLLRMAFERFDKKSKEFQSFLRKKTAYDYAVFMTLKFATGQKHFYEWEDCYKYRDEKALKRFAKDYKNEILFWQFIQFEAISEWKELKNYANANGVRIIGDLPLYSALDSVDVWCNPGIYKLDDNFMPKKVAGVPPDYFCKEGQLWGNPVYDYDKMKQDNFAWWTERIKNALSYYDYIRIDHFRGLDRYYEIDSSAQNAMVGEWIEVPKEQLFNAIHRKNDKSKIIAEDLGIIDDSVRELIKNLGYPGMKILSFAFNGDKNNLYLPENVEENSITYTGTHDNDTLMGLIKSLNDWDYNNLLNGVKNSLKLLKVKGEVKDEYSLTDSIIKLGFKCRSKLFIIPIQDLLYLDGDYRINTPGSVSDKNWTCTIDKKLINGRLSNKLKRLTEKYKREG